MYVILDHRNKARGNFYLTLPHIILFSIYHYDRNRKSREERQKEA